MIGAAAASVKETAQKGEQTGAAAALGRTARRLAADIPGLAVYAAGGALAWALKAFASGANASDLRAVLAPTCWLATHLGGMTFTDEGAAGFISHGDHLVVGTACSGVNFLIVCFGALFFSFARRFRTHRARLGWLVASLALAWTATIFTNAVRVVLAARLYQADIYGGWLTPIRLHRLLGVVLYCGALVLIHGAVARRWAAPDGPRSGWSRVIGSPFAWYLGVAVLVPLVRRAPQGLDARVLEHVVVVAGLVGLAVGVKAVAKRVAVGLQSKAWRGATAR
jgi:exosortase K